MRGRTAEGTFGRGLRWLESLGPQRIRPGLQRTRALLDALGRPERSFRSILIGGTNGKGSAAAACASILHAAGIRTGLYTSPHLVRVNERIRLAEADVADAALDDVLSLLAAISPGGDLSPTYFEALTVAAFELFRRARIEVGVVEVGLGGRLDATNVLSPEVSVVTTIGRDHLEVLGPALADVAREKAGIFRDDQPALTGVTGELLEVLHAEARRLGARLLPIPPSDRWDAVSPLPGEHQRSNLALAVAAASAVARLDGETIERGIAATRWPGRLQRVARPGRRDLLLDGAHNPDGAEALARHLDVAGLAGRVDLVFGGLADKDLAGVFAPLASRARRIVLVAPRSARACPPDELGRRLGRADLPGAASVAEALESLDTGGGDGPILVAGSLVLVGDALALLG